MDCHAVSGAVILQIFWLLFLFFIFPFRVAVVSKSFEGQTDRTEEWYGTQYKQEAITDDAIKVRRSLFWLCLILFVLFCSKYAHKPYLHFHSEFRLLLNGPDR